MIISTIYDLINSIVNPNIVDSIRYLGIIGPINSIFGLKSGWSMFFFNAMVYGMVLLYNFDLLSNVNSNYVRKILPEKLHITYQYLIFVTGYLFKGMCLGMAISKLVDLFKYHENFYVSVLLIFGIISFVFYVSAELFRYFGYYDWSNYCPRILRLVILFSLFVDVFYLIFGMPIRAFSIGHGFSLMYFKIVRLPIIVNGESRYESMLDGNEKVSIDYNKIKYLIVPYLSLLVDSFIVYSGPLSDDNVFEYGMISMIRDFRILLFCLYAGCGNMLDLLQEGKMDQKINSMLLFFSKKITKMSGLIKDTKLNICINRIIVFLMSSFVVFYVVKNPNSMLPMIFIERILMAMPYVFGFFLYLRKLINGRIDFNPFYVLIPMMGICYQSYNILNFVLKR